MDTPSSEQVHRYPLTVLESHLDFSGHMNHAVYLSVFEEARWDLVTERGYGVERMQETGQAPVILEISLKFRKELRLRQKVFIETRLLSHEKKIAQIRQEIKDSQGEVYCIAEFKFALFDRNTRKIINQTPEWLNAIGAQEKEKTNNR